MSVPKSVVKFDKDGVKFVSSVDYYDYTLKELCRAALRDVGKFICRTFRQEFYSQFKRHTGRVGRFTQYWVMHKYGKYPKLEVGVKPNGFYGGFQEFGTSSQPKYGLLTKSVEGNIDTIVKIESQYLSALDKDDPDSLISDSDYEGGADDT